VPIASASLGQVHCAEMRAGRPVAVKIHRPGVRQQVAMKLGEPGPDFDEIGFVAAVTELVDSQQGVVAKGIELGKLVLGVTRTASEHGVRIPADLSMLGKTLLNLDRVGRTLDLLAGNRIRFKVDAFDEVYMMEGLQKIANRITLGLVMAALIVGAALLMQVETSFTLLGYPGLAMILFSAAVAGVSPWP
jgi:ubiquinone biosynthesis protein